MLVQDAATKALTPELVRVAGGGNAADDLQPAGLDHRRLPGSTRSRRPRCRSPSTASGSVTSTSWHLVTAAMQMTMFQSLSADNPARRLLEPQSSYLIPFDDVLLLQWSAAAPPTSIATGRQFLELIDRYAEGRGFFDDDPTTQLEQLGLTEADFTVDEPWDQYPIVGDAAGDLGGDRPLRGHLRRCRLSDRSGRAARRAARAVDRRVRRRARRQRPRPAGHGLEGRAEAGPPQPHLPHHRARHEPPVPQRQSGADLRRQLPAHACRTPPSPTRPTASTPSACTGSCPTPARSDR